MSSYRRRAVTKADVETALGIVRAFEEESQGVADTTRSDLEEEWGAGDPGENASLVLDDAEPVAYGCIDPSRDPPTIDGYVHPAHFGRGIGTFLVTELEQELRARGSRVAHNVVLLTDEPAHRLMVALGYERIRTFAQMRITLAEAPSAAALAARCRGHVRSLPADAEAFHAAYEEAFADHWNHHPQPFDEWAAEYSDAGRRGARVVDGRARRERDRCGHRSCARSETASRGSRVSSPFAPGGGVAWGRRSSRPRSGASGRRVAERSASASTPRATRAPTGSTSGPACMSTRAASCSRSRLT